MTDNSSVNLKTISRLFHEVAFKDEQTRLTQKSLQLSAQYIRLFINEAILRSNEERIAEGDNFQVDGIDNVETARETEADVEEEVPDITLMEEDISTQQQTQYDSMGAGDDSNTLDTRHLSKVAGVLILDF